MRTPTPSFSGTQTPQEHPFPKLHHSISLPQPSIAHKTSININKQEKNAQKIKQLFNFPQLKNQKPYQKTIKQIANLMNQFDKFTDNLQMKVDLMLAAQQNQFIDSYKNHMKKVQVQFKSLQKQLHEHKQLIKYYENEGKMSNLIKKVAILENQSKKIYGILEKKQKQIKQANREIKVHKEDCKRLYTQVRQLTKNKSQLQIKLSQYEQKQYEQKNRLENQTISIQLNQVQNKTEGTINQQKNIRFFTTEVNQQRSLKKDMSITTTDNKNVGLTYNLSEQTITINNQQQQKPFKGNTKLRTQLANLSHKHRRLARINSKIMQSQNQLQNLFINSVAQIKKNITIKRKIKQCTFEDFKKQDKINLLLTIISNQDILKYVYERIFNQFPISDVPFEKSYSYTSVLGSIQQRQYSAASQIPKDKKKGTGLKLPYV